MMKKWWLLLGVTFAGAVGAASPEHAWHAVRGAELQAQLADHDLGDGVHYAYQFHRDGRLTGAEMGKKFTGTWKATAR